MANDQELLEELKELEAHERQQKDFDDLNAEMAGRAHGPYRFLSHEQQERIEEEKRGVSRKRETEPRLDELLRDPEYARIYSVTVDTYERAVVAADRALRKIDEKLILAERRLNDMRAAAGELPTGVKIFRSEQSGRLHTETGAVLPSSVADTVETPSYAPSWETFSKAGDEYEGLQGRREAIVQYQGSNLEPARVRLTEKDSPASKSELQIIQRQLEVGMPPDVFDEYDAPAPVREIDVPHTASAASHYVGDAGLNAPNMGAHFDTARNAPTAPAAAPMPNREFVPKPEF